PHLYPHPDGTATHATAQLAFRLAQPMRRWVARLSGGLPTMTKFAPSLSCRLARSRRTLAAFLLLGGAAMSGLAGPAAAHDHAAPTIDLLQGMAEALPQQPGDAAAPLA